jgi:hypothetical protein
MVEKENTRVVSINRKISRKPKASLEYELMASLCFQQYGCHEGPDFQKLLSIPVEERIMALINDFGIKNMHKLVRTMLQEFSIRLGLPESRKLSVTGMSACACDIILAAEEDHLSMEDLVIFFQLAGEGKYGRFKSLLTHFDIMEKLATYRSERNVFYEGWLLEKEKAETRVGPLERTCPEPTLLSHLIDWEPAKVVAMKVRGSERW